MPALETAIQRKGAKGSTAWVDSDNDRNGRKSEEVVVKRKGIEMDFATIVGLTAGVAIIVLSILGQGETMSVFKDYTSLGIVIGGAFSALLVSMPLRRVLGMGKVVRKACTSRRQDPEELIRKLVGYAEIARRDGILALDTMTEEMEDKFIVKGIQMAVDGTDPNVTEQIMTSELEALSERHRVGKAMFDCLGKYAPAFGMIGTLIGLIIMLQHMDNVGQIGTGMAVALTTTFYGAVAANLIFLPIADKLGTRSREEILMKQIIIRGILSIQSGDNPRIVEQKLRTFLPPELERKAVNRRQAA